MLRAVRNKVSRHYGELYLKEKNPWRQDIIPIDDAFYLQLKAKRHVEERTDYENENTKVYCESFKEQLKGQGTDKASASRSSSQKPSRPDAIKPSSPEKIVFNYMEFFDKVNDNKKNKKHDKYYIARFVYMSGENEGLKQEIKIRGLYSNLNEFQGHPRYNIRCALIEDDGKEKEIPDEFTKEIIRGETFIKYNSREISPYVTFVTSSLEEPVARVSLRRVSSSQQSAKSSSRPASSPQSNSSTSRLSGIAVRHPTDTIRPVGMDPEQRRERHLALKPLTDAHRRRIEENRLRRIEEAKASQNGGKKSSKHARKEILGKIRCVYKVPGSRKDYIKYKGNLIAVKMYKQLMKKSKINAKLKTRKALKQ
jgi:hypothetical protein